MVEDYGNQHGYRCPRCGRDSHIHIAALVDVKLTEDGAEYLLGGEMDWGEFSPCWCTAANCGWDGEVDDLTGDLEERLTFRNYGWIDNGTAGKVPWVEFDIYPGYAIFANDDSEFAAAVMDVNGGFFYDDDGNLDSVEDLASWVTLTKEEIDRLKWNYAWFAGKMRMTEDR